MSTKSFALKYIAKAAAGVPRDLGQLGPVGSVKPIRPTVLIYNCTWVCDARCEMCNNWKRGDRKADMTLEQLDRAMDHPFWGAVENLNISGGEPTTRNDLPEMVEMFLRRLPRLRKIGINTTGLTPHRAIPMLTRIVEFCAERDILFSVRVSLDGIGDIHDQVRHVKRGFDKAGETIEAMQALAADVPQLPVRHRRHDLRHQPGGREEHPRLGARARPRHRLQHAALHRRDARQPRPRESSIALKGEEEEFMRQFFLERVAGGVGAERPGVHVPALRRHDRQRLHRTMPCPFQTQGLLLNPNGELFYCENSKPIGNVLDRRARPRCTSRPRTWPTGDLPGDDLPDLPEPVPGERRAR